MTAPTNSSLRFIITKTFTNLIKIVLLQTHLQIDKL